MSRRDVPSWVNKCQFRWPDEFAQVKPNSPACDEDPLDWVQERKNRSAGSLVVTLPPDCQCAHGQAENNERHDLENSLPTDALILQPQNQKQRCRERASGCLGRKRQ